MVIILTLIGYFLSIVASALLIIPKNIFDSAKDYTSLILFCIGLITVAELICFFSFKFPLKFLKKEKNKKSFENFLNENFRAGASFSEFKKEYEKKAQQERNWFINVLKKNRADISPLPERRTEIEEVEVEAFFGGKLQGKEGTFIFWRNRCNNLRTILYIVFSAYFIGISNQMNSGFSPLVLFPFIFVIYASIMACAFYGVGFLGCFVFEGLVDGINIWFNTNLSVKSTLDIEDELRAKLQAKRRLSICADCGCMINQYTTKPETYEKPNFEGFTTSKTTYKEARIGEIRIDDQKINMYGDIKDKTTVTAYGYKTTGYYCPYCRKKQYSVGERLTAERSYKWK